MRSPARPLAAIVASAALAVACAPPAHASKLDKDFGSNGFARLGSKLSKAIDVELRVDSHDRLFVFARLRNGYAVARFKRNGGLDRRFGSNGVYSVPRNMDAMTMYLDSRSRVLLTNVWNDGARGRKPRLLRLNDRGVPDRSFGAKGSVASSLLPTINSSKLWSDVYVLPGGRIALASGRSVAYGKGPGELRLLAANGRSLEPIGPGVALQIPDVVTDVRREKDGRLLLAGAHVTSFTQGSNEYDYTVSFNSYVRAVNADGVPDQGFGTEGIRYWSEQPPDVYARFKKNRPYADWVPGFEATYLSSSKDGSTGVTFSMGYDQDEDDPAAEYLWRTWITADGRNAPRPSRFIDVLPGIGETDDGDWGDSGWSRAEGGAITEFYSFGSTNDWSSWGVEHDLSVVRESGTRFVRGCVDFNYEERGDPLTGGFVTGRSRAYISQKRNGAWGFVAVKLRANGRRCN